MPMQAMQQQGKSTSSESRCTRVAVPPALRCCCRLLTTSSAALKQITPFVTLAIVLAAATGVYYGLQVVHQPGGMMGGSEHRFAADRDLSALPDVDCGDLARLNESLSWMNALYLATTIHTSIGYGDVIPCTRYGKLTSIVLACIGIPLTVVCLKLIGQHMAEMSSRATFALFEWAKRLCHVLCAKNREQGDACEMTHDCNKEYGVNLAIGIIITVTYILAITFYFHESFKYSDTAYNRQWGFFDAFYFIIITLFTVGFGDINPTRTAIYPLSFSLIFVGLALVSMCVALAQKAMETQFDRVMHRLRRHYNSMQSGNRSRGASRHDRRQADLGDQEVAILKFILNQWKFIQSRPTSSVDVLSTTSTAGGGGDPSSAATASSKEMFHIWKAKVLGHSVGTQTDHQGATTLFSARADCEGDGGARSDRSGAQGDGVSLRF